MRNRFVVRWFEGGGFFVALGVVAAIVGLEMALVPNPLAQFFKTGKHSMALQGQQDMQVKP